METVDYVHASLKVVQLLKRQREFVGVNVCKIRRHCPDGDGANCEEWLRLPHRGHFKIGLEAAVVRWNEVVLQKVAPIAVDTS